MGGLLGGEHSAACSKTSWVGDAAFPVPQGLLRHSVCATGLRAQKLTLGRVGLLQDCSGAFNVPHEAGFPLPMPGSRKQCLIILNAFFPNLKEHIQLWLGLRDGGLMLWICLSLPMPLAVVEELMKPTNALVRLAILFCGLF